MLRYTSDVAGESRFNLISSPYGTFTALFEDADGSPDCVVGMVVVGLTVPLSMAHPAIKTAETSMRAKRQGINTRFMEIFLYAKKWNMLIFRFIYFVL
jgi:hypothetical protein